MKRLFPVLVITALVAVLGAVPATAGVDDNPNSELLVDVTCPDAGLFFPAIWSPTVQSVTGHDLENNLTGVAKSIWVTNEAGDKLFEPLFDRPGRGLDELTVWCQWADDMSPTGLIGGDILFNANVRP